MFPLTECLHFSLLITVQYNISVEILMSVLLSDLLVFSHLLSRDDECTYLIYSASAEHELSHHTFGFSNV